MSDAAFNSILTEVDNLSYEQCAALLAHLSKVFMDKKNIRKDISPIDRFFATVDESDSDKMLEAVQDCRRIEPGELLFGAEKSHLKQSTRDKYLQFCLSYPLLDVTKDVAQNYGGLKYALQAKGTIIPENDMWIGAIAITHGMTVLTND